MGAIAAELLCALFERSHHFQLQALTHQVFAVRSRRTTALKTDRRPSSTTPFGLFYFTQRHGQNGACSMMEERGKRWPLSGDRTNQHRDLTTRKWRKTWSLSKQPGFLERSQLFSGYSGWKKVFTSSSCNNKQ